MARMKLLGDREVETGVAATVEWLRSHPAVERERLGTTGFCMGARGVSRGCRQPALQGSGGVLRRQHHGAVGRGRVVAGLSATATVVSDYVSLSDSRGALQVSVDYSFAGGIYLGVWTSNYDFGTEAEREADSYPGFARGLASVIGLDVGVAHYHFLREPESNYNQVWLGGSYGSVDARLWYSDDYFGTGGYEYYVETGVRVALPRASSLQLRAGYTFFGDAVGWESYANGQLIVGRSFYGVDIAVRATATSDDQFGDRDDARLIVSVAKKFG